MAGRYIPERNDIVFLDFEPTKGKEIGKYRPALVLSSKAYNQEVKRTGNIQTNVDSHHTALRHFIIECGLSH